MQVVLTNNKAKLIVRVIEARGLKIGDVTGSSDPFVEIRIKDQSHYHRTRIVKQTTNPFWNEQFELFPNNPQIDILSVKIYDYDMITTNDLLGEVEIPVSHYMSKPGGTEEWVHLQKKHGYGRVDTQGDIRIFVQYQGPIAQAPVTPYPVQYGNPSAPSVQPQMPPPVSPQYPPQSYPSPQPQYPVPTQQYPPNQQYPTPTQQYPPVSNSVLNQPYPYPQQPPSQPYPQPQSFPTQPPPQQYPPPPQQYPQQYPQPQNPPQQYPTPQQYPQPQYPPQQYLQSQPYIPAQQYPVQSYPQVQMRPQVQTYSTPVTYPLYTPSSPVSFVSVPQTYTRIVYTYPSAYSRTTQFVVPIGIAPQLAAKMLQASAVFRAFDTNYSGYLSKKEWKRAMYQLGYAMNKYDAKRLFYMVDKDMSGKISEREFCEFWLSTHPY